MAQFDIVYSIEHLDRQGGRRLHTVAAGATEGEWLVRMAADVPGSEQVHAAQSLADLVAAVPALHRICPGVTWIVTDGDVSTHALLDALHVLDPAAEPGISKDWEANGELPDRLNEFLYEDEELADSPLDTDLEVLPRWVRVNGARAVVVREPRRAALLLLERDLDPVVTDPLLGWGFYGQSGGPCSWDGGATIGRCGPRLWVQHRWGDVDPARSVSWAPTEAKLVSRLVDALETNEWELAFLRAVLPFPGLTRDEQEQLERIPQVEGDWVSCHLSAELGQRVMRLLIRRNAHLRASVHALVHPHSARGKIVYGWLRALAKDPRGSSWREVDSALLGEIEPPPEDDEEEASWSPPSPSDKFMPCRNRGTHLTLAECWMCQGDVLAGRATEDEVLARDRHEEQPK